MRDMSGLNGLKDKAPSSVNYVDLEPERYELHSPSSYHFEIGRREFFRILGGGIVVACVLRDASALPQSQGQPQGQSRGESGGRRGGGFDERLPQEISAWLHIG